MHKSSRHRRKSATSGWSIRRFRLGILLVYIYDIRIFINTEAFLNGMIIGKQVIPKYAHVPCNHPLLFRSPRGLQAWSQVSILMSSVYVRKWPYASELYDKIRYCFLNIPAWARSIRVPETWIKEIEKHFEESFRPAARGVETEALIKRLLSPPSPSPRPSQAELINLITTIIPKNTGQNHHGNMRFSEDDCLKKHLWPVQLDSERLCCDGGKHVNNVPRMCWSFICPELSDQQPPALPRGFWFRHRPALKTSRPPHPPCAGRGLQYRFTECIQWRARE